MGVTVLVENRLIGMKSRGVYETPGGTILYEAHKAIEQICIERDTLHLQAANCVAVRRAWFTTANGSIRCAKHCRRLSITPTATVSGHREGAAVQGPGDGRRASSPHSLYDSKLASFSMEGYDVTAARGFIDLFGLPMKVAAQARKW